MSPADLKVLSQMRKTPQGMRAVLSVFIARGKLVITQPLQTLSNNDVLKLFDTVLEMSKLNRPSMVQIDLDKKEPDESATVV